MEEELRKEGYVRTASHRLLYMQKGGQITDHRASKEWDKLNSKFTEELIAKKQEEKFNKI